MKRTISAAAVVLAAMCGEGVAFAQQGTTPAGYPAVYHGAVVDPRAKQVVAATLTLEEAYDDNLLVDAGGVQPGNAAQLSGLYSAFSPELMVQSRGDRLQFSALANSNVRYYNDLHRAYATNHGASVALATQLTNSTSFSISQTASYAPAYQYALFAAQAGQAASILPQLGSSYQATSQRSLAYGTSASVTHSFGRRASLTGNASYHRTDITGGTSGLPNLRAADGGFRWTYNVDRNVKVRLGYTYRRTEMSPTLRPVEHDVEVGMDYVRPLSRTRSASVGFSIGPVLMSDTLGRQSGPNQFRVIGDAFFNHQFSRTWHVRSAYHRGLTYIEGLTGPAYTDGVTADTGGFINRRVDLAFSTNYAVGTLPTQASTAQLRTYSGIARLRVGLTARWAAYLQGSVYEYDFDRALLLTPDAPRQLHRANVLAGLTLWIPVRSR